MAQMLMDTQDLDLASRAHKIMQEAVEAVQRSSSNFSKLQRRADHLQS